MGAVLRGQKLVPIESLFDSVASRLHGHVQAVLIAMRRLGIESLLASRPSRERNLAMAMIAARVLQPHSKLATTRWWKDTTLPGTFSVWDATEVDLYSAMDWLLSRQRQIEKKLAARHLTEGGLVLYDLTSSYFEGTKCPLAAFGHNRDGKKGKLQVNYGLLTDRRGCPVAVSVFKGNTGDPKTLLPQVNKVRQDFGIEELGPRRRSGHDFAEANRPAGRAQGGGVDHRAAFRGDQKAHGRGRPSDWAVR